MAKILNKLKDTIKKTSEALKNTNEKVEPTTYNDNDGSWIGKGNSKAQMGSARGTSTDYGSYQEDLERLSRAQQQAQVAELKQARDRALASLDAQEQSIKPTYQNARNQASAASRSGARSFAEYLANRGLTNSGAAAQGEINRLSTLQNTLGGINTAEANAYRDIANQRTAVENDYIAGIANANNAIAQQYYNNMLNYNQQQRDMINQLNQQALGQYSNDYQAQIDNLLAQGYSPNSLEVLQLQALRGNKVANNYSSAMQNAMANIQAGNINYNNAAAVGMTVPQAQQYYNNLMAQQQAQAQAEAEQQAWDRYVAQTQLNNATALNNANIANKNASTANYYNQIENRNTGGNAEGMSKGYASNLLANEGYFTNDDTTPSGVGDLTNAQYNLVVGVYDLTKQGLKETDAKEILADNGFTRTQIEQFFN